MKRSSIKRKAPIKRKKKINKVGKAKAKKRAKYRQYMASREWKERRAACLARAGRRCEYEENGVRCIATTYLQAHHKSYKRFTKEQPEDLMCLCKAHHELIESQLRPWNRRRRSA